MISDGEFWGRDAELGELKSSIDRARSGHGQVVLVSGPCGIGKSSLLAEVERLAIPHVTIAAARAEKFEQDLPFAAVRSLLLPLVSRLDASRRSLLPPAAWQALRASDVIGPGSSSRDEGAVEGLWALAVELCEDAPLVLVLDDLQWADLASVKFLFHLLPSINRHRCCVIAALEEDAGKASPDLLRVITADQRCHVLRLPPLSSPDVSPFLREVFTGSDSIMPDAAMARACHDATGGNPLFVRELLRMMVARKTTPSVQAVADLGPVTEKSVRERVILALRRLPEEGRRLILAAAVLGQCSHLSRAARLADMPLQEAQRIADEFRRVESLLIPADTDDGDIRFVHPLVRAAVYDTYSAHDLSAAHARAAQLLRAEGESHTAAVHLLRTRPGGGEETVRLLLEAADSAQAQGSPEAAAVYLRRCLAESLEETERASLLCRIGRISLLNDTTAAVRDLTRANEAAPSEQHAETALALGKALLLRRRGREAMDVWQEALTDGLVGDISLHRQLRACTLAVPLYEPGQPGIRRNVLRQAAQTSSHSPSPTLGENALDCVIAGHHAVLGDPRAVSRALSALRGSSSAGLARLVGGDVALAPGWLALIGGDRDEVLRSLDEALSHAHRTESLTGLALTLTYRAMAGLAQGNLAEAEAEAGQAGLAAEAASVTLLRNDVLGAVRTDIALDLGRLEEAEKALVWAQAAHGEDPAPTYRLQCSRARLLRLRGETGQALETALAAGRSFANAGGANPALSPWMSEAALCLHTLGNRDEALELAYDELRQARNWSAPRAWGRALRTVGLLQESPASGLEYLRSAVDRLRPSWARLEYAKALTDCAAVLRTTGQEDEASQMSAEALGTAQRCGAEALVRQIRARQPADLITDSAS